MISVSGFHFHLEVRGSGKPIVCLHGFAEDLSTWGSITLDKYQMVLIDLPGHGQSDKPEMMEQYRLPIVIDHLHALIRYLDLQAYTLMGYSMGGRIALSYTLAYPNEVDRLILESSSYGECGILSRYKRRRNDAELARKIQENGIEWFERFWAEQSIFQTQSTLPPQIRQKIKERRLQNETHALANTLLANGQGTFPCLKRRMDHIKVPILYICGEKDHKYRKIGSAMQCRNKNTVTSIITSAGHNTHIERPELFTEAVTRFLNKD